MEGNKKQEKEPITFFTLPGELRNKVYSKVLKRNPGNGPARLVIVVRYDAIGKGYAHIAAVDVINHEELEPYFGMFETNVQIGSEVSLPAIDTVSNILTKAVYGPLYLSGYFPP